MRDTLGGCLFAVRVHPGAKRDAITRVHDGALKVSLTAPPNDGKANQSLLKFLSGHLRVATSGLELVNGAKSRAKLIAVADLSGAEILTRLGLPSD